ncbi:hypothetical protein LTS17_002237 [Exophiala oligosperma]
MSTTQSANNADEVAVEKRQDRDVPLSSSPQSSATTLNASQQNQTSLPRTDVVESGETAEDPDQTSSSGSSEEEQTTSERESEEEEGDKDEDEDESEDQENITDPADDWRALEVPSRTSNDLRSRLQTFLPQIESANLALQENPDNVLDRRLDDVSDSEEHYIEMNLGLGVLSERRERSITVTGGGVDDDDDDDDNSTSDSDGDDGEDDDKGHSDARKDGKTVHDGGVLADLKGEKTKRGTKRKVEDLG